MVIIGVSSGSKPQECVNASFCFNTFCNSVGMLLNYVAIFYDYTRICEVACKTDVITQRVV
eukprot:5580728-Amphidinium_carterae.1